MHVELTQDQLRILRWFQHFLSMPLEELVALPDEQKIEMYLLIEERITGGVVILDEWNIPKFRITPGVMEIDPATAHPLEYAWWQLHHRWLEILEELPFETAHRLSTEHAAKRDDIRRKMKERMHRARATA